MTVTDTELVRQGSDRTTDYALQVSDLRKSFGGVAAVNGATFGIEKGAITGLIGPNGAGKSTVVNLISGSITPDSGSVKLNGEDITGLEPHEIGRKGLIRTFQISREYPEMTVLENLIVSAKDNPGEKLFNVMFRPKLGKRRDAELVQKALETLLTFGLYPLRNEYAANLSGGQKRLLELSRAVMAEPTVLLLDEPMAGVNPALIEKLGEHIVELNQKFGTTFVLVEHNLEIVEKICSEVVVVALGATLAVGTMAELRKNKAVVDAYLGGDVHERVGS